jgi:hypothetical protein
MLQTLVPNLKFAPMGHHQQGAPPPSVTELTLRGAAAGQLMGE